MENEITNKEHSYKRITVSLMRDLEKQVLRGEISYSKMIEILNTPNFNKDSYTDDEKINLIACRIIDEYRKHHLNITDWHIIAAKKIYSSWNLL